MVVSMVVTSDMTVAGVEGIYSFIIKLFAISDPNFPNFTHKLANLGQLHHSMCLSLPAVSKSEAATVGVRVGQKKIEHFWTIYNKRPRRISRTFIVSAFSASQDETKRVQFHGNSSLAKFIRMEHMLWMKFGSKWRWLWRPHLHLHLQMELAASSRWITAVLQILSPKETHVVSSFPQTNQQILWIQSKTCWLPLNPKAFTVKLSPCRLWPHPCLQGLRLEWGGWSWGGWGGLAHHPHQRQMTVSKDPSGSWWIYIQVLKVSFEICNTSNYQTTNRQCHQREIISDLRL